MGLTGGDEKDGEVTRFSLELLEEGRSGSGGSGR